MKKHAMILMSAMLVLALVCSPIAQTFAADTTTGATPWDGGTTSGGTSSGGKTPATTSGSKVITPAAGGVYVVKSGDVFWKIAKSHNLTIDQLKALNPAIKNPSLIIVGQKIVVKSASAATPTAPTAPVAPTTPVTPTAPTVETRPAGLYTDIVTSPSVNLTKEDQLKKSLGETGTWITTLGKDTTVANDLVWVGDLRKEGAKVPGRKLGIYYHSSPNIGGESVFTLKVPNLIVKAENANLAYGKLDGNVKVEANGFKLTNCTITGNLEFATKAQYDSAKFNDMVIKGDVIVAGAKLAADMKPQTITNFAKYDSANAKKSDMMKAAVTFKDGKAHDVAIDVFGTDYFIPYGVLSSNAQGNWGKVSYSKAGLYVMVKPSADRSADTIFAWHKQMETVTNLYKESGYDLSKIPTCERDATHPSVLDFNKMLDGKYKAYTVSTTNGAIDATKLKGAERSAAVKADAVTSVTVDVGKYLKLADNIVKAGVK